ncbi:restriction endonuclease [Bacillus luteolus]|uniref:Restriction endonuclease n=1 Tax=Litchfieldia luteola TaxID=682179 RepID=A0ABR9QP51_9BACI|nr:restriction endonuclease [Cytobacillus luteolus]MBE4910186.1 restriction endonuclease [Cytobacillus luteolus]MBP1942245.1 hypothetical protein [Cytobacillus luteolus]
MLRDKYDFIYNFVAEDPTYFIDREGNHEVERLISIIGKEYIDSVSRKKPEEIIAYSGYKQKKKELHPVLSRLILLSKLLVNEKIGYVNLKELWKFTNEVVIDFGAESFSKNFKRHFKNIENITLHECVIKYLNIEELNSNNGEIKHKFLYFLMKNNKFTEKKIFSTKIIKDYSSCIQTLNYLLEKEYLSEYSNRLLSKPITSKGLISINDVDLMTGEEFEKFVSSLFEKMGYRTEQTKISGDQGIDVIAEKNAMKIGIQAKRYSGTVSNSAIQEVVAGVNYYNLSKGLVITNSRFSKSAIKLAEANKIVLWDRTLLVEKINEVKL